jgi:UDP-N-acetylenolpyruvoylglucosamine reductase
VISSLDIRADYPLARLTTVGVGGPARWFAEPRTASELDDALGWARDQGLALAVVGLGSNLLAADDGFDGLVVRLAGDLAAVRREGTRVVCGGGAPLAVVVRRSRDWGLAGIEFGCAIPGTVGGAVRMNAGAYGRDMAAVLDTARVAAAGGGRTADAEGLELRYRHSNLRPGEVVAEAALSLRQASPQEVAETVRDLQRRRRAAQPAKVRTFGSVWKNPDPERTAGLLLDECGLRGFAIGGARISPVHANFIENTGGATARDVLAVMAEARRRARERFNVELEHEVRMLGDIRLPED